MDVSTTSFYWIASTPASRDQSRRARDRLVCARSQPCETMDHAFTTLTTAPPPLVPDAADLLGFGTARTGHCDIKETLARTGTKTAFQSRYLPPDRQGSAERPLHIDVKTGHDLPAAQDEAPWHLTASGGSRRSYNGLRITRCVAPAERIENYTRWRHADERGTPFTRHITFKPPTDHLTPEERILLWERVRQRVRCFCRDCRSETGQPLECVMMTSRESKPKDSTGEHMHMLVHMPEEHQATFDRIVPGWFANTKVTPSDHREEILPSGKVKSGFGYLHKAADPTDCKRDKRIWYRRSGAIAGERTWSTRNLHRKARADHAAGRRAAVRLHRERVTIEPIQARMARHGAIPSLIISPTGIV